jgi:hypothetical protein
MLIVHCESFGMGSLLAGWNASKLMRSQKFSMENPRGGLTCGGISNDPMAWAIGDCGWEMFRANVYEEGQS